MPTTTPEGITFCTAAPSILPEALDNTKLDAATPATVLVSTEIVLLVSVTVLSANTAASAG